MYNGAGLAEHVERQTGQSCDLQLSGTPEPPLSRDATIKEAMREFCPVCRGDWLKAASTKLEGAYGTWQSIGRKVATPSLYSRS